MLQEVSGTKLRYVQRQCWIFWRNHKIDTERTTKISSSNQSFSAQKMDLKEAIKQMSDLVLANKIRISLYINAVKILSVGICGF